MHISITLTSTIQNFADCWKLHRAIYSKVHEDPQKCLHPTHVGQLQKWSYFYEYSCDKTESEDIINQDKSPKIISLEKVLTHVKLFIFFQYAYSCSFSRDFLSFFSSAIKFELTHNHQMILRKKKLNKLQRALLGLLEIESSKRQFSRLQWNQFTSHWNSRFTFYHTKKN